MAEFWLNFWSGIQITEHFRENDLCSTEVSGKSLNLNEMAVFIGKYRYLSTLTHQTLRSGVACAPLEMV